MKNIIKLFDPVIDHNEEEIFKKILYSHSWSSGLGKGLVSKFEEKFKKFTFSKDCVAVSSGSAALHLALSLLPIKNKEVILPSMTFVSTAHAIIMNGGIPIFVDLDPKTLCIDPDQVQKNISKKTRVILPVHFGGWSADLDKLNELSQRYELDIIEDAAHATGTTYHKKPIGSNSFAVCHSFNPTKNLAMPNGGAITLNEKNTSHLKTILNSRRWCGIKNRQGTKYDVGEIGWNYFMNEFSAGMGISQLKKIKKLVSKRKKIAKRYSHELTIENKMLYHDECSYHLYWIQIKKRDEFMKHMKKHKIETGIHFQPIHEMSYYKIKSKLPITSDVGKQIVSLPIHPNLTDEQISQVIFYANKFK